MADLPVIPNQGWTPHQDRNWPRTTSVRPLITGGRLHAFVYWYPKISKRPSYQSFCISLSFSLFMGHTIITIFYCTCDYISKIIMTPHIMWVCHICIWFGRSWPPQVVLRLSIGLMALGCLGWAGWALVELVTNCAQPLFMWPLNLYINFLFAFVFSLVWISNAIPQ